MINSAAVLFGYWLPFDPLYVLSSCSTCHDSGASQGQLPLGRGEKTQQPLSKSTLELSFSPFPLLVFAAIIPSVLTVRKHSAYALQPVVLDGEL